MQFFKALLNMSPYTSAIFCECRGEQLRMWAKDELSDWAAVEHYLSEVKKCKPKTLKRVYELGHHSYELSRGEPFKPVHCGMPGCNIPTFNTAQAMYKFHANLDKKSEEDLAAYLREYGGSHLRHRPGPPVTRLPPLYMSVDILHLIFINLFGQHVTAMFLTPLFEMSDRARGVPEALLRSKSIPIKLAHAASVTEMKQSLTGRDAKTWIENGEELWPELLTFALAPPKVVEEEVAIQSPPADGDFTMAAPEGEESEDEGEGEEDEEDRQTKLERYASYLDDFHRVVHLIRPFERDDREYRERRATDLYNSAAKVGRNLEQLLGDYDSAVPSILTDIVTRQMVQDGCAYRPSPALARPLSSPPGPLTAAVVGCRRGCDGHEAFGAKYHFTMHNRVCIRKLTSGTTEHKRVRRVDATRRTESPARRCYPPC